MSIDTINQLDELYFMELPFFQKTAKTGAFLHIAKTVNYSGSNKLDFPTNLQNFSKKDVIFAAILIYLFQLNNYSRVDVSYSDFNQNTPFFTAFKVYLNESACLREVLIFIHEQQTHINTESNTSTEKLYIQKAKKATRSANIIPIVVILEKSTKHNIKDYFRSYLKFVLSSSGDGFEIIYRDRQLQTNGVLTDETSIKNQLSLMTEHIDQLLHNIIINAELSIEKLSYLTPQKKNRILFEWNQTQMPYNNYLTLHGLFEDKVKTNPNSIALACNSEELTYAELNIKANQLARCIRALLVEDNINLEQRFFVGIYLERDMNVVVSMLAILKAGGAYVPLDIHYPIERINMILTDTNTKLIVSKSILKKKLQNICCEQVKRQPKVFFLDEHSVVMNNQMATNLNITLNAEKIAYIIYTSGSTGTPKGVMIKHQSAVSLILWAQREFNAALECVLFSTSICFDLSVFEVFATLAYGGIVYIVEGILSLTDAIPTKNVTLINTVPSSIFSLLKYQAIPLSVNTVNLAGEPLSENIVCALAKISHISSIYNLYGPSETTTYSTFHKVKNGILPIQIVGRPIDNTAIYILDKYLKPVTPGIIGQIYISGSGVACGYLNQNELTKQRFVNNPFSRNINERMYKTGDLARYLPDGNIEYIGRMDSQVKLRGYRIEPGEIETCLLRYPGIHHAAVILKNQSNDSPELYAYVASDLFLDKRKIRGFLQKNLPNYMVPSLNKIIITEDLPKTENGKIDKKALAKLPVVRARSISAAKLMLTCQSTVEAVWSQALACIIDMENDYNFFEMGGNSLIALEIVAKLNSRLQLDLSLYDIFSFPVFSEFMKNVVNKKMLRVVPVDYLNQSSFDTSKILLTHEQLDKYHDDIFSNSIALNNLLVGFSLKGPFNILFFSQSVDALLKRHPILTMTIVTQNDRVYLTKPKQEINFINFIDLSLVSIAEQEVEINKEVAKLQRFNENNYCDPLFFITVFKCKDEQSYILLYAHHIITDLHSLHIIEADLLFVYQNLLQNRPYYLPEFQSFAAYSYQEELDILKPEFIKKLTYLKHKFCNKTRLITFADKTDDADNSCGYINRECPVDLIEFLNAYAKTKEVSMFVLMLAIFKVTLYQVYRQSSFAVGSIATLRTNSNLSNTVGLLVNYLVTYSFFTGDEIFSSFVHQVNTAVLDALQYVDVPYSLLRTQINSIEKSPDIKKPLFNIFFDYQEQRIKESIAMERFLVKGESKMFNPPKITRCLSFRVTNQENTMTFAIRYKKSLITNTQVKYFLEKFIDQCYNISDNKIVVSE